MKKLAIALTIVGLIGGGVFLSTHHRVYGKCHQSDIGYQCTLIKWVKN